MTDTFGDDFYDDFESDSIQDRIGDILRPHISDKLVELLGLPAFLASEMVEIQIDGPYAPDGPGQDYITVDLFIDHPLLVDDVDIAMEVGAHIESLESVEMDGKSYLLHACSVYCQHSEEFEDALDAINDGLDTLFNNAAKAQKPDPEASALMQALEEFNTKAPPPRIWVESGKTPDNEDILIIDAEESALVDPALRVQAAAIIAKALAMMENPPQVRCEGNFPELKIEPPRPQWM